jgi:hypothetical protein
MSRDPSGPGSQDDDQAASASDGAAQSATPVSDHASDKSTNLLSPEDVAAAQRMLLNLTLSPDQSPAQSRAQPGDPVMEELADDVLQLLRRMSAVEQRLDGLAAGINGLGHALSEGVAANTRQVDALRRDLLGDRRSVAVGSTFGVAVSALDSLTAMQAGLDPGLDLRLIEQLAAVTSALTSLLERLGFVAFEAVPGEPFDPTRMRCLGFSRGTPGLVLAAVSPGYAAGGAVVRPAGVLIADPTGQDRPPEESVS